MKNAGNIRTDTGRSGSDAGAAGFSAAVLAHDYKVSILPEQEQTLTASRESWRRIREQILKEIPYSLIVKLDEKTYGPGLYLGKHLRNKVDFCLKGEVYDFLTKDGVVIGKMEINFPIKIPPNYYDEGEKIPVVGVLLPRDLLGHDWRPSFDDLVCRYCVYNPKALEYIPQETLQKFPKLQERKERTR